MTANPPGSDSRMPNHDTPVDDASDDGSPRAKFEALFQQHNDALLRYVRTRVDSMAEAREIVQEAYVRILGLGGTREISHLRAYLYKTVGNISTDRLREREKRERQQHLMLFQETSRETVSPDRWWEAEEDRLLLEHAVEELPPKCRLAFTLVELDEMELEAVARHMGILPASVRKLVDRAYGHLVRRMATADGAGERAQDGLPSPKDRSEQ